MPTVIALKTELKESVLSPMFKTSSASLRLLCVSKIVLHKKRGAAWLPFSPGTIMVDYVIFSVAFLLMARLAFRRPLAMRATKTVATQKIMAMTDSIVRNSNILTTS